MICKILIIAVATLILNCASPQDYAGSGSSTGNAFTAIVLRSDSTPAEGAEVRVLERKLNATPSEPMHVGRDGRIELFFDSEAAYNIQIEDSEEGAIHPISEDSIFVLAPYGTIEILTTSRFDSLQISGQGATLNRHVEWSEDTTSDTIRITIHRVPQYLYNGINFILEGGVIPIYEDTFEIKSEEVKVIKHFISDTTFTPFNSGLPNKAVFSMALAQTGEIWFGTSNGVVGIYNGNSWSYVSLQRFGINTPIYDAALDRHGSLWIATYMGLINLTGSRCVIYNRSNNYLGSDSVQSVLVDTSGYHWASTRGGGISRLSPGRDTVWRYTTENSEIQSNYIWHLFLDYHKRPWLTSRKGVAYFENSRWHPISGSEYEFTSDTVTAAAFDRDRMWFGTGNGSVTYFENDAWHRWDSTNSPLTDTTPIWSLFFNKADGSLWIGTEEEKLHLYYKGEWRTFTPENSDIPEGCGRITSIIADLDGNIWVATARSGVVRFRQEIK